MEGSQCGLNAKGFAFNGFPLNISKPEASHSGPRIRAKLGTGRARAQSLFPICLRGVPQCAGRAQRQIAIPPMAEGLHSGFNVKVFTLNGFTNDWPQSGEVA